MIILPCLDIFLSGGYLTHIFILTFVFGCLLKLVGVRYGH